MIVAIAVAACLLLSFVWPVFRTPVVMILASFIGISAYGAPRDGWREPDFFVVLGVLSAIGLVLFLVRPT